MLKNLLNLLDPEATLFSIFGAKTRDFKIAAVALTQVENILLANVVEIKNDYQSPHATNQVLSSLNITEILLSQKVSILFQFFWVSF